MLFTVKDHIVVVFYCKLAMCGAMQRM